MQQNEKAFKKKSFFRKTPFFFLERKGDFFFFLKKPFLKKERLFFKDLCFEGTFFLEKGRKKKLYFEKHFRRKVCKEIVLPKEFYFMATLLMRIKYRSEK